MAVTFACPKGDQSDDAEYCSVCGIKMEPVLAAAHADPSVERCPACGVERHDGARFCETCRYDFEAQSSSPSTPVGVVQEVDTGVPSKMAAAAVAASARYWEATIAVDATLDVEPDPDVPCPVDTPERTFPLDLAENLVGRRSTARGILPSIALNDPGVSHRHLMVYRNPDATLTVSDLGSTNGTFLNGSTERLQAGVKTPIADGDRVEVGRWTRITFHCRS
ncbi:MAG: FHA domain-containing protein [Chloroflexi bacterium]|nr:FHA domain-containing protein [Chloroflexota bacterium]